MKAAMENISELIGLVHIVWPGHEAKELEKIISGYICSDNSAVFAKKHEGALVGAALCSLRNDYVEGCDSSPVGYLEGIGVKEGLRGRGIAKELLAECEQWAREKGCREFASDCELSNTASLAFHLGVGFEEQNRIICFKKEL